MDEKIIQILMDIKSDVAACKATLSGNTMQLQNHETRISKLEDDKPSKDDNFKSELLKLLAKGLLIGLLIIGTLTGSANLIKDALGIKVQNNSEVHK